MQRDYHVAGTACEGLQAKPEHFVCGVAAMTGCDAVGFVTARLRELDGLTGIVAESVKSLPGKSTLDYGVTIRYS